MITDALLELSLAQPVTVTAVSTNTVDLSVVRDIGAGEDIYAQFAVDVAAAAVGLATVTFEVITSAAAALTAPTVISATGAIPIADLAAGRVPISVCLNQSALTTLPIGQRYLGVRYTVASGPLTAGSFTCYITDEASNGSNKIYPSGFSVL